MPIEINDELISQWEPKIQKLLENTFVLGLDKHDLEQELRIAIVKAAKGFNEDRGVIFHTYLHTAMINTIRTLISKAQRSLQTLSLDEQLEHTESTLPFRINKALLAFTKDDEYQNFNVDQLTMNEQKFLTLRLEGFTMGEITQFVGESAYKLRQAIQQKVGKHAR